MLCNFKVGGFKVFGETVELNLVPETKNTQHLSENVIIIDKNNVSRNKFLKTSIIYGGNNTGKSSIINALEAMKNIYKKGDLSDFPFYRFKNFCYAYDDLLKFEVEFYINKSIIVYGIEFKNSLSIGEYIFINGELFFSKDVDGIYDGTILEDEFYKEKIKGLTKGKLFVPFLNDNYQDHNNEFFEAIETFSK